MAVAVAAAEDTLIGTSSKGCSSRFLGCFTAVLVLAVALGALIYFKAPTWLQRVDENLAPWAAKKMRLVMGKMALRPLYIVIDESGLSGEEKKTWKDYLETCWESVEYQEHREAFREALIEHSRRVVLSPGALYYALEEIRKRSLHNTSLSDFQIKQGKGLVKRTMIGLKAGVYADSELEALERSLYSVLVGARISTTGADGEWEEDQNLRDFFRALLTLQRQKKHFGPGESVEPTEALRWELEILQGEIEALEQGLSKSSPSSADTGE